MTNNERFNAFINSCENPRLVLDTLRAMAPVIGKGCTAKVATAERAEENNIRILTDRLNACKHRREIYNVLCTLCESLEEGGRV